MTHALHLAGCQLAFILIYIPSVIQAADQPNFVVILTDDQSWVGSSVQIIPGDERTQSDYFQTPNIERLAQMGMRFTQGYAPAASCCPTRRAIQTGQFPARHVYHSDREGWKGRYREQLNIPRMLKAINPDYATAHFGKWDHRYDGLSPQKQGYDVSDGVTGNGEGGARGTGGPAAKNDPKKIDAITDRALRFLSKRHADRNPFYLQVSHYAVHLDVFYKQETLDEVNQKSNPGKKHTMPEFAAMTSDLDTGVGRILDKLMELDLLSDTYVIFMSDNGGRTTIPDATKSEIPRNAPLRNGKHSLYEGGLRVPFIVLGPQVPPNSVCTVPVTGVDLLPTFADLAGFQGELPSNIDGGSMRSLLHNGGKGEVRRLNPFLVFHQAADREPISAIRFGDFKLVKTWNKDRLELFDLSADLSEKHDLSPKMPHKTTEMHSLLTGFLDDVGAAQPSPGDNQSPKGKTPKKAPVGKSISELRSNLIPGGLKPNVLLIAVDDLNDWIGALGGHPQALTPNLDRLISKSVLFTNAHCAAPVCSASRHAFMSGLRPSTTGWYSNTSKSLKAYERTLGKTVPMPTHFKRNGYKTLAAGKVFHKGTSDVKGYDYWDEERPKFKWPAELAQRGHGYQSDRGGHFHPFPKDGGAIYQKYGKSVNGHSLCWGALSGDDIPDEGMPDEQIAEWAVQRLQQPHDQPFFMAVGFVRPHVPFTAPEKYFDLYPMDTIEVPTVPADEMDDVPLWGKAMAYGTIEGGDHFNVLNVGPNYWKEMTRAYLACVSFVDAQAGKVLDALQQSAHSENTIVIFWSDHGQHLGEKNHWRKMALWEEATRVPLSVRLPGNVNAGEVSSRSVSLIDLYPTLIDLCDLPRVSRIEGTSLVPQLADSKASRRNPAITTWHYNNHSARSQNFRYIRYRDGSEELYDHRTDPNEHNNLAADPKWTSIKKKLAKFLPEDNVVPKSIQEGGTDSYGKKFEMLRHDGVPDWLGTTP